MITTETESRREHLESVARAMMAAARTAPKGRGIDNLEIAMVTGSELTRLAQRMRTIAQSTGQDFFHRDAGNVENSEAVVLIGVKDLARGLDCGLCGYPTCAEKNLEAKATPCSFSTMDLGIAIGSAVSVAADHRIDNRVMYSAGAAALELGMTERSSIVLAVPISCTGKSIYYDRKGPGPVPGAAPESE